MAIHIDQITSEVLVEADPQGSAAQTADEGQALGRTLEQLARLVEDRRRVSAEGFDD